MALQSSGPISLSEIATEQGISTTNMSLRSMSATAGFSTPDAITEFYGYSAGSDSLYYYLLQNSGGHSLVRTAPTSPFNLSSSQDFSVSMWVQQNGSGAVNYILFDMVNTLGSSTDRVFLQYHSSLNRFVARMRTNSTNFSRQWALHSNNSATGTGTNSSVKWSSTNRGNVNSDGWCLITLTYDASQSTGANAWKLYWNDSELTSTAASDNGTRTTKAVNSICIGNNGHNYTTTGGALDAGVDEFKIYDDLLTSGEVSTIYNSGVIGSASSTHSANLVTEFTFEEGVADSGVFTTAVNSTGTQTAH